MSEKFVDLRSDTATRPTAGMRAAMAAAAVGDDVFGEDPTIIELQQRVADLLGKEAAIYVPSGTMSNQIGLRLHCRPGDEFICEAGCHIYNYEQAGHAQLSGLAARAVEGTFGILRVEQLDGLVRPTNDHLSRTRLLCLENTHNRGAGRVQPYESVVAMCEWARENSLATHLDGARLFNAVVATGIDAAQWAKHFDTVSVCFSKGLGAPVGSALVGPRDLITQARRHRKLFGGGMRQAGIIAAGALYALENHISRLADDHANAQLLADLIQQSDGLELRPKTVDTNIVILHVAPEVGSAVEIVGRLAVRGVLMLAIGPQLIRAVTHLDVTRDDVLRAGEILAEVAADRKKRPAPAGAVY